MHNAARIVDINHSNCSPACSAPAAVSLHVGSYGVLILLLALPSPAEYRTAQHNACSCVSRSVACCLTTLSTKPCPHAALSPGLQIEAVVKLVCGVRTDCLPTDEHATGGSNGSSGGRSGGGNASLRSGGGKEAADAAASPTPALSGGPANYLLQHSAGSGKSLTIAALAAALLRTVRGRAQGTCGWR